MLNESEISAVRADADKRNRETSEREVQEWMENPPYRYFAYVNEALRIVTTWMGDSLGSCYLGKEYRDNFNGLRVSIWVRGINGRFYQGTYFKSAGNYCRIKQCKPF